MNPLVIKNKDNIIFIIFLIISLLFMIFTTTTYDITPGSVLGMFIYPFVAFYDFISHKTIDFFTSISELNKLQQENKKLKEEIKNLKELRYDYSNLKKENQILRNLLNFQKKIIYKTEIAKIIGKDPLNLYSVIVINKGRRNGIRKDMPVFSINDGEKIIIGKVIEVSLSYSKVMTIFDPRLYIGAKEENSNYTGIVRGNTPNSSDLICLYFKNNINISYNDVFKTSGMDGIFPEDLIIGYVKSVKKNNFSLYQSIILKPAIDLAMVDYVYVVKKENELWNLLK